MQDPPLHSNARGGAVPHHHFDPDNCYAPVAGIGSFKCCASMFARSYNPTTETYDGSLEKFDYVGAFTQTEHRDSHIFITAPAGYGDLPDGCDALHVKKWWYGLSDASRGFYENQSSILRRIGFNESATCPGLFYLHTVSDIDGTTPDTCVVATWVDDGMVYHRGHPSGSNYETRYRQAIADDAEVEFHPIDPSDETYALGIRFRFVGSVALMDQSAYLHATVLSSRSATAPFPSDITTPPQPMSPKDRQRMLSSALAAIDDPSLIQDPRPYQSTIGALHYLNATRPDVATAVSILARYTSKPTAVHYGYLDQVLDYLSGTSEYVSVGNASWLPPDICAVHVDASGNFEDNGRARGGHCVFSHGTLVSSVSKALPIVTCSTFGAETVALNRATRDAVASREWLAEINNLRLHPTIVTMDTAIDTTPVYCDNRAAVIVANDPARKPSKAIHSRYLASRDMVRRALIDIKHIGTADNRADGFTKPLIGAAFSRWRHAIGVTTAHRITATPP